MKNEINEKPALIKTSVIPSFLKPSAVVRIENAGELAYVLAWCDLKKIKVAEWQRDINNFPIALSLNQVHLGWTNELDRALDYISFNDYFIQVNCV